MKIGSGIMTDSAALLVLLGQPYGQRMDKNASRSLHSKLYNSANSVATVIWHHLLH